MNVLPGRLIESVMELRQRALRLEQQHQDDILKAAPGYRASARNLLHYLALRQVDIRALQDELASLGLSSLGRLEAHTLNTLDAVLVALHRLAGREWDAQLSKAEPVDFMTGRMLLREHTQQLFGSAAGKRSVRIMVTMPSEAATDPDLVSNLLTSGMDVMRINCAHDDPDAWLKMIDNLRQAERQLGRTCKVYADLARPKLRTGAIQPTGRVLKVRPRRNFRGEVETLGRVLLTPSDGLVHSARSTPGDVDVDAVAPVEQELLSASHRGDVIQLVDARGRRRELKIKRALGDSRLAETDRTIYFAQGQCVRLIRKGEVIAEGCVGALPEVVLPIELSVGDTLVVTRETEVGQTAKRDKKGKMLAPARIPCTLEAIFSMVKSGERTWFDDGKIGGRVMDVDSDGERITVQITHAHPQGAKLRSEKGINLPDTRLTIPALTEKDLDDLQFLVKHVDMVGLSFARTPEDVALLVGQLQRWRSRSHPLSIVLKIENRQAFENLPRLLLTSLQSPPVGVMVARGDLAVEIGFERLAEVQEEILWLCEAAHVPVIWATQVLESMAKTGSPSRAEVSDAVMSGRAECVMLNKGPYIVDAVRLLSGVLERMDAHQSKKRTMLRKLSVSKLS